MKVQFHYSFASSDDHIDFTIDLDHIPREGEYLDISRDLFPSDYPEQKLKEKFGEELGIYGSVSMMVDFVTHKIGRSGHEIAISFALPSDLE
ncbi:hypothetical protein [Paraburkholderia sp. C35]|uniref:hypothetical protein n=1 Tax=Paraburkholderia sp. C35 TaxID=2126993 RepID=UPI000D68D0F1|nr:hypothetical protein [Paraburkholderia sp. C35]